jgi:hypothetical protein
MNQQPGALAETGSLFFFCFFKKCNNSEKNGV